MTIASVTSRTFSFYRKKSGVSEFTLKNEEATVRCGEETAQLSRLGESDLQELEKQLEMGSLMLKALPEAREPAYLFEVNGTREIVLVTAPQFNFHDDYEV